MLDMICQGFQNQDVWKSRSLNFKLYNTKWSVALDYRQDKYWNMIGY